MQASLTRLSFHATVVTFIQQAHFLGYIEFIMHMLLKNFMLSNRPPSSGAATDDQKNKVERL